MLGEPAVRILEPGSQVAALDAPKVKGPMRIVPVDPAVDPKFIASLTPGAVTFTMRSIPPSVCR